MKATDLFYLQKEEPVKSCLLALRTYILANDAHFSEEWKYQMPFFYYKGKMFCYLWTHKKTGQPYLGMVAGREMKHPALLAEKRTRIKILPINPHKDLPIKTIQTLLQLGKAVFDKKLP